MGPSSFQWCPVTGQRGNVQQLEHRKLHTNIRKNLSTLRVTEPWHRLPKGVGEFSLLEIFRSAQMCFCVTCGREPALAGGWTGGSPDVPSKPHGFVIL